MKNSWRKQDQKEKKTKQTTKIARHVEVYLIIKKYNNFVFDN